MEAVPLVTVWGLGWAALEMPLEKPSQDFTLQNENFHRLFSTAAVYRNIVASIQMSQ